MKLESKQVNFRSLFVITMVTCVLSLCIAAGFAFALDTESEQPANNAQQTQTTTEGQTADPSTPADPQGTEEATSEETVEPQGADDKTAADKTSEQDAEQSQEALTDDAETPSNTPAQVNSGLVDDDPLPSNTGESDYMKYYYGETGWWSTGYDVQGVDPIQGVIKTTYGNSGYPTQIQVNGGTATRADIKQLGKVYTYDGVQVKQNNSFINNGESVLLKFTLCNTNSKTTSVKWGGSADVQIGGNDNAAITLATTEREKKITMLHDQPGEYYKPGYGMKFTLQDTEESRFTGCWIGYYTLASGNVFSSMSDGTYSNHDSGLAFHWARDLEPGQQIELSCVFNVQQALKVTSTEMTSDAVKQQLNMKVNFEDAEKRTQTLHYKLQGDETEYEEETSTGEGVTTGSFNVDHDFPTSWEAGNTYSVTLYVTDDKGYRSRDYTYYAYCPSQKLGTKVKVYFKNTSTTFATLEDVPDSKVTLPSDTITGKEFLGWNTKEDGTGTWYQAGEQYTIPTTDSTLYAQWGLNVSYLNISTIPAETYTGSSITPELTIKDGSTQLVKGTDYTLTYKDNTNAGTATITVTGLGKYVGARDVTFTINQANMSSTSVADVAAVTYTGSALTPEPDVTFNGAKLTKDSDFTYSYENNTNAGTATITMTAKENGNFKDSTTKQFTINKAKVDVPTAETGLKYSGEEQTGVVSPEDAKYTLTDNTGTDAASYTAIASLSDKNNYDWNLTTATTDDQSISWEIAKRQVTLTSDSVKQAYSGSAVSAKNVTVTGDGFVEGEAKIISYENFAERTDVGISSNCFEINWGVVKPVNYVTEIVFGTLEVTSPESADIKVDSEALNTIKEKYQTNPTDNVTVDLEVSQLKVKPSDVEKIQAEVGDKKLNNIDATLKVVVNGTPQEDAGDTNETIIPVTYNYDFDRKTDFEFYRVHKDVVSELTEDPNEYDENVVYDKDAGTITINAAKYSCYTVAYNDVVDPVVAEDNAALAGTGSATSDSALLACITCLVAIVAAGAIIFVRRRFN